MWWNDVLSIVWNLWKLHSILFSEKCLFSDGSKLLVIYLFNSFSPHLSLSLFLLSLYFPVSIPTSAEISLIPSFDLMTDDPNDLMKRNAHSPSLSLSPREINAFFLFLTSFISFTLSPTFPSLFLNSFSSTLTISHSAWIQQSKPKNSSFWSWVVSVSSSNYKRMKKVNKKQNTIN